jgi:hypothetical protein
MAEHNGQFRFGGQVEWPVETTHSSPGKARLSRLEGQGTCPSLHHSSRQNLGFEITNGAPVNKTYQPLEAGYGHIFIPVLCLLQIMA